jgi:hypothetical protein
MKPMPLSPEEMQVACDRFNRQYAVGDVIRCWPFARQGDPVERIVREPACILGGNTPVVYISGGGGCVALTNVQMDRVPA